MPLKEFKALHRLVDRIFDEAHRLDWSWNLLAEKAGLTPATVYNLGDYKTMYPRAATVFQLARAVGFEITLTKAKGRLKIAG